MQKICSKAAVERFIELGREGIGATSLRGSTILVGMARNESIEPLVVGSNDILDIRDILQAALNFERRGTGFDEFFQVVALVQVLERQQVALMLPFAAIGINQIELHAAYLGTLSAVGRASETILRGIALTAIANAQGSMYKHLEVDVGDGLVDSSNLVDRQFASKHHTPEALAMQPAYFLYRTIIGLCRGMQLDGREIEGGIEQCHILYKNGVDTGFIEFAQQLTSSI